MTANRIHDLLPWFVNETLEPAEAESFERHLMDCADCRKELEFLKKLQRELDAHGEEFLDEHPAPEQLISLLGPGGGDNELDDGEIAKLKRHLALCATCAEEASWLRGEATASAEPRGPESQDPTPRRLPWAAVAAMLLAAVALTAWLSRDPSGLDPGTVRMSLLQDTERTAGDTVVVEVAVAPDASHIFLLMDVILDPQSFPAALEIVDADGRTLHEEEFVERDLLDRRFLSVSVLRRDFPDGNYVATVTVPADPEGGTQYPFRVMTESP